MIEVFFPHCSNSTTTKATQWDIGQMLYIHYPELTSNFEVHFANDETAEATVVVGHRENNMCYVIVPEKFLQKSKDIKAWVYVEETNGAKTKKTITIKVEPRPKPSDYVYMSIEELNPTVDRIIDILGV